MEEKTNLGLYYNAKRSLYRMSEMRKKLILGLIPEYSGDILEIGCGRGEFAQILKSQGHHVTGVDISESALKEAAPFLKQSFAINVEQKWPQTLCDMRFDTVIASEVIEHLFDPDYLLHQIHDVLTNDGTLIL